MPFFLVGPTAVGKTALAIELAEQFDAEIVNADAFQVYRGLDVLTAKPDAEAQRRVRHHVLSQISLFETMSAASFRELARAALSDVHSRKKNAIVVGGSGLYLKAITHGLDQVPPPEPTLREPLNRLPLKEIPALISGQISREECIAKIQQATRRYAKRQLTWFRHQTTFSQLNLTPFSHREAVHAITQMFRRALE